MDPQALRLAGLRLARVQAMAWGHPVTSGLPAIDLFLSSAAMAVEPDRDWTLERRVDLPGLGIHVDLDVPRPTLDRGALGLPADRPLLLQVQTLAKYRAATDDLHARIAAGAPDAVLVFVGDARAHVTATFRTRLEAALRARGVDPSTQLVVLPRLDAPRWHALLAHGDLFLDGPGWSGGRSTLEALAHGLPPLAFPRDTMRGRHTRAMVAEMGLSDALAPQTPDDWVARAVALARDPAERTRLRTEVEQRRAALFGDRRGVAALADALQAAARS